MSASKKYSFWITFKKGFIAFVLFAIPFFINAFPEWANLTVGAVLVMLVNFFKFQYSKI